MFAAFFLSQIFIPAISADFLKHFPVNASLHHHVSQLRAARLQPGDGENVQKIENCFK